MAETRVTERQPRYQDPLWCRQMAVRLDYNNLMRPALPTLGFEPAKLEQLNEALAAVYRQIGERSGLGGEFLGFLDLPFQAENQVAQIQRSADRLAQLGDRHVVLGIGGSYLGAKALADALTDPFRNEKERQQRAGRPRLYFEGNNLDPESLNALLDLLPRTRPVDQRDDFTVTVISKSGTTLETAVAFRILRQRLEQVYGSGYSQRLVAVTDAQRGLLKAQADREGFETFVIPDDVGGRFSVFSPVGLLPAAVVGIDISELLAGAKAMARRCQTSDLHDNPAYAYAALQHLSRLAGREVSVLAVWAKALEGIAFWYDQLCAESLGKNDQGRIPISSVNTRDLHARGQQLQQGPRTVVITNLAVDRFEHDAVVLWSQDDPDQLNYLAGKSVGHMLQMARAATTYAYGRVERPSMTLHLPEINPFTVGQLLYLFELATAVEGYLSGINPLDQPGVEDYKRYMFALLGRADMAQWRQELSSSGPTDPAFVV